MLNWESFQPQIQGKALYFIEYPDNYTIWMIVGSDKVICKVYKNTDECLNFETNYKTKCNKQNTAFPDKGTCKTRFRGYSFGTAIAGEWTTLDIEIENDRYFRGIQLCLKNHVFGDNACLQVIDKNNILGYGNNIVLETFGDNWFVDETKQLQDILSVPYRGLIKGGLFMRLIYDSVGATNVEIRANLELYSE